MHSAQSALSARRRKCRQEPLARAVPGLSTVERGYTWPVNFRRPASRGSRGSRLRVAGISASGRGWGRLEHERGSRQVLSSPSIARGCPVLPRAPPSLPRGGRVRLRFGPAASHGRGQMRSCPRSLRLAEEAWGELEEAGVARGRLLTEPWAQRGQRGVGGRPLSTFEERRAPKQHSSREPGLQGYSMTLTTGHRAGNLRRGARGRLTRQGWQWTSCGVRGGWGRGIHKL